MSSQIAFAAANGVVLGMAIFLVAAGLTLVFGILKVFNFAHGAFFMIGAYVTHAMTGQDPSSLPFFLLASLGAAVIVGAMGILTDTVVLRRLAGVSNDYTLIAMFDHLGDYRGEAPFGIWVRSIAVSRCLMAFRSPLHLARVALPMLFLQGTRDDLADLTLVREVCAGLGERATLHVVEGADHSFGVLKRSGRTGSEVLDELADTIAGWARRV